MFLFNHRSFRILSFASLLAVHAACAFADEPRFQHHFADDQLPGRLTAQTALVDLDQDGDLDFITGHQFGTVYWYEYQASDKWVRHLLGEDSPSDVGGAAMDVNGDGWIDYIAGGAWYENPGKLRKDSFRRHTFDADLTAVHDVVLGDIDGDGKKDVVVMSDKHDARWYKIPKDAFEPWKRTVIGEPTHSGISLGDIDRDGDMDVVRSNAWFENTGQGSRWKVHVMTPPWGRPSSPRRWDRGATQTRTADINGDGRLDVVISEETRDAHIAWIESPADPKQGEWKVHYLRTKQNQREGLGGLHSLAVEDFNLDGKLDIMAIEMEGSPGDHPPRWFIWEGPDKRGKFVERVILNKNLGGHEAVVGDVDQDGDIDICSKPWKPGLNNGNGGRNHFDYLENTTRSPETDGEKTGWIPLFDGQSLAGWKTGENPESCRVEDGAIVVGGERSHLFYVGTVEDHHFKDFEFKAEVKTEPGADSGVYFHTKFEQEGWPQYGYEAGVNNSSNGSRRTGSLCTVDDVRESPVKDNEWFEYHIAVRGKRIVIKVNGKTVVDYTEPDHPAHLKKYPHRLLSGGTFALQSHDRESIVRFRNLRVRPLH